MKVLKVINECSVGIFDVETEKLIDTLSSRVIPAAADDYIEGQINLFESEDNEDESCSSY